MPQNVPYHVFRDAYITVHMCQNLPNPTLKLVVLTVHRYLNEADFEKKL